MLVYSNLVAVLFFIQEWCPYPPVVGKVVGAVKSKANLPVFDVRTKGKNIEVRLNTSL